MTRKVWRVDIELDEQDRDTRADLVLEADETCYRAWGRAHRNPVDPQRPHIGDELAVARALEDLARQLRGAAVHDIEALEGHPVEIHG